MLHEPQFPLVFHVTTNTRRYLNKQIFTVKWILFTPRGKQPYCVLWLSVQTPTGANCYYMVIALIIILTVPPLCYRNALWIRHVFHLQRIQKRFFSYYLCILKQILWIGFTNKQNFNYSFFIVSHWLSGK